MKSLECLTARCLLGIYWLLGLLPLPPRSQLVRLSFVLLVRCIWSVYCLSLLWMGMSMLWENKDLSISYISGTVLFIGNSMLGLFVQCESILKHRSFARLQDLRFQTQLHMQRLGMSRGCRGRALRLLLLLGTQLACDAAKFYANSKDDVSPVLTTTLALMWLLRFRYVQLLEQVIEMNQRALQLRHSLLGLADGNDIWQPYGLQEDRHVQTLRLTYDRIFECYETFSDCYGWGMLGLQVMCGFEFVSNAYWIITEAYRDQQVYMLVFNGATCLAMGSLITSLFWYGDASTENCTSSPLSYSFDGFQLVAMQCLSVALHLFHFTLSFYGVRWNTRLHRLQLLILCVWVCWYLFIWTRTATQSSIFDECTLDCLITHTLFLMLTVGHVIVLLDTFVQRRCHHPLWLQERNHFEHHRSVMITIYSVVLPCFVTQFVVSSCRFWLADPGTMALTWVAPSALGLHLKLYGFLSDILIANVRVDSVRKSLLLLARQQSFRTRQTTDVDPLIQLKHRYSELNLMFAQLNLAYGNSVLIIFIVLFLSLIFNTYWLVKNMLLKPESPTMLIIHFGIIANLGLLFSAICWHCQQSYNHSRQIGCLISKLVKPLGSKRYNDLVCEFLLQTLHQRFVLTAKDFFSLNLHLLSSMCAAVVTYLVILIQFMFAEKSSQVSPQADNELELNLLE